MVEFEGSFDTEGVIFDHIHIMGVIGNEVNRVIVNGAPHSHFTFNSVTKVIK